MKAAMCENLVVDCIFPPKCLESLEKQSRDTCESGSMNEIFLHFIAASAVSGMEEKRGEFNHCHLKKKGLLAEQTKCCDVTEVAVV